MGVERWGGQSGEAKNTVLPIGSFHCGGVPVFGVFLRRQSRWHAEAHILPEGFLRSVRNSERLTGPRLGSPSNTYVFPHRFPLHAPTNTSTLAADVLGIEPQG